MTTDEDQPPIPRGRPSKYDPKFCDMLIEDMARGYSMTAFAGLIGVCKATLNVWMDEYPDFLDAVQRAKAIRLRDWEKSALLMRANGGGNGSATITIFGLKNMGAGEWDCADKSDVNVTQTGVVRTVTLTTDDPAEAAKIYQQIINGES